MKKFLSLASVMAITGCLLSCNDVLVDDYAPSQSTPIAFSASIKQDYTTRINDEGFVGGDRMGVFVVDYVEGQPGTLQVEKNRADNVAFTYDATTNVWTGESDVYWKDKHSAVDVFGYYPYQRSVVNVDASLFEVAADQSIPASDGEMSSYEASDFLWAKAAGVTPDVSVIRLAYQHRMAGIFVTLVEGEGFSDGQWETLDKQVLVCNTRRTAEINLSTGVATPIGELDKHIVPSASGDNYRAVVVPQAVEAGKALLSITIDGTNYFYTRPEAITYLPGRLHQFTMQVDKRSESGDYTFTLLTEEITPWQNDEASHSFETSTYVVIHVPDFVPLQQCIEAAGHNYLTLQNLKLTGYIQKNDFTFMRDKMPALKSLNLKHVRLQNYEIPSNALSNKKLKSLVLPDQGVRWIGSYAFKNAGLTGSCIIPEGVKIISISAFDGNPFDGDLVLPTTLEVIHEYAFNGCAFNCELKLPARLKSIGHHAFYRSEGQFQGELILPEGLTHVGTSAFEGKKQFNNQYFVIPGNLTKIESYGFYNCINAQGLVLHDGVTEIGQRGLGKLGGVTGELHLPASLKTIGAYGFVGGGYSSIHFPENIMYIDRYAFSRSKMLKEVILPNSLKVIEDYTFEYCWKLESVYIPENIEYIGEGAFSNCGSLSIITCAATTPPILYKGVFDDAVLQNATLVVPESAIDAYRNAEGWKEFISLAPRIEIESNVSVVKVSNRGISEKEVVLKTTGAWVVESMPDWCHLSQTTGENRKTLLQLTIPSQSTGSGNRMGEIVLRLRDKEYHQTTIQVEQYDVTEAEEINLQTATRGPGIQLFLLGDGFDAQEVYEGKYIEAMRQQMENFFDIEPYRTYRDYFTVNTALVVSPESGIGSPSIVRSTRFNTNSQGINFYTDYVAVHSFVTEVASGINDTNLKDALVVLVPNSSEFGGHTQLWPDGSFLSICPLSTQAAPYDARGIIQHEAGGHGFAKLGDEDAEHYDFITGCCKPYCNELLEFNEGKERGWYANLSLSDKMSDLPWQHLIFDPRYSMQVDIFEGGFDHARAMYRSEESSIMRNYESYFNAISRETIVRRIMELAGEPFDFETFVANDKIINP